MAVFTQCDWKSGMIIPTVTRDSNAWDDFTCNEGEVDDANA